MPPKNLIAQCIKVGTSEICGPIGKKVAECVQSETVKCEYENVTVLSLVMTILNSFVFPIAGVIIFFTLVSAGYDFLSSQGDAKKLETAWSKITYCIVGFAMMLVSFLAIRIASGILGFDNPLGN